MALKPAVFIDKDGTLIHDLPYNVDPALIRLRDGAAEALICLRDAGFALILVSNQSGVALGRFPEEELQAVWKEIAGQLAGQGVTLDGIYYCPHHPQGTRPGYGIVCDCRKPQAGLLLRAAADHRLELERSWLVGDILDDVEAGRRAGCQTVLLDVGSETEWLPGPWRQPHFTATSLPAAAACILAHTRAETAWAP